MNDFLPFGLIKTIEILGTFAFAISGIRLASAQNVDWFGAYIIGLITAIGGGTVRDVLLNETPFWMLDPSYIIVSFLSLLVFLLFSARLTKIKGTLFVFDTIGLGLFVVAGIEKTLQVGFDFWVAIVMGMITGTVGGVLRDVLINETPLIFRQDIYATACLVGGLVYWVCSLFDVVRPIAALLAALTIIIIRLVVVRWHLHFPVIKHSS